MFKSFSTILGSSISDEMFPKMLFILGNKSNFIDCVLCACVRVCVCACVHVCACMHKVTLITVMTEVNKHWYYSDIQDLCGKSPLDRVSNPHGGLSGS